jgi:hypothetical protein
MSANLAALVKAYDEGKAAGGLCHDGGGQIFPSTITRNEKQCWRQHRQHITASQRAMIFWPVAATPISALWLRSAPTRSRSAALPA